MIVNRKKLDLRLRKIREIIINPESYYQYELSEDVKKYSASALCEKKERVVSLGFQAPLFEGLQVRELFIQGSIYSIRDVYDIFPTVLWHLNCYKGEYIIAFFNDRLMPWLKLDNPFVDVGYSIFSGHITIDCRSLSEAIYIAQELLLLIGIPLNAVGIRCKKTGDSKLVKKLKQYYRKKQEERVREESLRLAEERKREKAENQKRLNAQRQANRGTEGKRKVEGWAKTSKEDLRFYKKMCVSASKFAWQQNSTSPRTVLVNGVLTTLGEVLSGEDCY
jgi:hypothetical protein